MEKIDQFYKDFSQSYIQTFDDTGNGNSKMVRQMPMSDIKLETLKALNKAGAGIFFTPNPCKGGRKEENVTEIQWVYVDMDEGTKKEMGVVIGKSPIKPHIIIESKRSYHLYWKVDMMSKDDFDFITKGLIEFYNGDPAISSINEVLRVPGFFHMKDPNEPYKIKTIYYKIKPLSSMEMRDAYPSTKNEKKPAREPKKISGLADRVFDNIKDIPVEHVLDSLGIEYDRNGFIIENGEITSAHIHERENYVNRFSGKDGSGSTIDVVMHYGNMDLPKAIQYLKDLGNIDNVDIILEQEADEIDIREQNNKIFTWGTKELDKKISPINNDSFIVFAGESGSGKTAFTFDMAIKNAHEGHKVLYLSLEMNTDAILTRIAREYAGITKEQWRNRKLITDEQVILYKKRKQELQSNSNLKPVGFTSGIPPTTTNLEKIIKKVQPDLVFIDNLDLIEKDPTISSHDNENSISKKLLDMSKCLPMPIILIHHLKKGEDKDLNKPRNLNSLRGSGKIVHNADIVMLGFRPPFKDDMTEEELSKFTVIQLKDRDFGIGGFHPCYFHKGSFYDSLPKPFIDMDARIQSNTIEAAENVFGVKAR